MKKLFPLLALLAIPLLLRHRGEREDVLRPRPIPTGSAEPSSGDRGMDESTEERSREERDAWIERMHKAPPDVDWRAIERANGERQMARRKLLAQTSRTNAAVSPWNEVGSSNLAGRMWCATIASDGSSIYAGSDLGGLWKGDLAGSSWRPLGDDLYGGAYDVASIPGENTGDPDVLLVRGANVYVTRDEGATWEPCSLPGATTIRGIGRLATSPPTLCVLAQTTYHANAPALFVSTDWGRTFTKRFQHPLSGPASFWIPRRGAAAATTIYLMIGGSCFVSTDAGASFAALAVADPTASGNVLTGSEAGGPTLYAALESGGTWNLWRSDDGGATFVNAYAIGGFYGTLAASIVHPNVVVWGDIEAHRSTDSGATFASINAWGDYYGNPAHALHADIFGLDVFPDPSDARSEIWFVGCDGGLFESADSGATVQNVALSGLGVSQYYSTLTSKATPGLIVAGAQDQGYQRGSYVPPATSGPSTPFTQLISGDYGHLTSSDGTHARVICTYPGFILIQDGEQAHALSTTDFPAGSNHDWLPAVVADPTDANVFYFCGNFLWKYTRQSNGTWVVTQQSAQDFSTGGSYLTALAFAPSDPSRVYAVNDGGRIWWSTDHGVTWTPSASSAPGQQYFYGNAIAVHPTNAREVAIGGSGYGNAAVVRSTNGGASFAPEATGLPQTLVYSLVYATDGSGDLFAGHQTGAIRWRRSTATWEDVTSLGSPITVYWCAEVVDGGGTVRFGTYGRGIWDDHLVPLPSFTTYGVGKTTSLGSQPALAADGTPSYSKNDFAIDIDAGVPGKFGRLLDSATQDSRPFMGGHLYVGAPFHRGPTFNFDPFAHAYVPIPVTPAMVGTTRYYQAWFRDPQQADGTGVGLSNGGAATFGQ